MNTNPPRTVPQWWRIGTVVSASLFVCLPASLLLKGTYHEAVLALGLVGLGACGLLLAIHGLFIGHLPKDPLGRFPSAPGNNPSFYWFTVLVIFGSALCALLFGFAGLLANYTKLVPN